MLIANNNSSNSWSYKAPNLILSNKLDNGIDVKLFIPKNSEFEKKDRVGSSLYLSNIFPTDISASEISGGHLIPFYICGLENDPRIMSFISKDLNQKMCYLENIIRELNLEDSLYYRCIATVTNTVLKIEQLIYNSNRTEIFKATWEERGYIFSDKPLNFKEVKELIKIQEDITSQIQTDKQNIIELEKEIERLKFNIQTNQLHHNINRNHLESGNITDIKEVVIGDKTETSILKKVLIKEYSDLGQLLMKNNWSKELKSELLQLYNSNGEIIDVTPQVRSRVLQSLNNPNSYKLLLKFLIPLAQRDNNIIPLIKQDLGQSFYKKFNKKFSKIRQ